jgi:uncharacterized HAD superfamily protein/adenine/guanine phosphoribosyltransferase-like PRPP-binding protein
MDYKCFSDLNEDIRKNIGKISSYDFDLVVGIPRSGMVPAYMIALLLNKECTDITSLIENKPLKRGITRQTKIDLKYPSDAKKIVLVDDSIMSGESLKHELLKIPDEVKSKITTLAIYSSLPFRKDIDLFFEYVPAPRVFEWNVYHHSIVRHSCVDIDGVLCVDPTEEENDDGGRYRFFLLNAKPLILPHEKIHTLVTNRLEKYRPETEAWLKMHNVEYANLIMLGLPSKEERQRQGIHAKHKAKHYLKSELNFFIESDKYQAEEICKITSKPVFCVENNRLYTAYGIKNPRFMRHRTTISTYCRWFIKWLKKR